MLRNILHIHKNVHTRARRWVCVGDTLNILKTSLQPYNSSDSAEMMATRIVIIGARRILRWRKQHDRRNCIHTRARARM